ncbi:OmpA family protein [Roseovarius aestuarii]|uniref:Outer membrane porin F n=1 Tax=Roseovarius aestuarii TaxID=475083 RepID=A0A1X7BSU2_9RHOB|nr:OmpA family protein [Roseovarius aestuarii]SMC12688.1 Outer membrane porin F precursor [Roseovarius aestuarii]
MGVRSRTAHGWLKGLAIAAISIALNASAGWAQSSGNSAKGERYIPTIWVDPDGCEHWVMDDGFEGFMTPHVTRDGKPVCRRGNLCGVVSSDQLFATDSARISAAGKARLRQFFRQTSARGFVITGHTDSRASDAYNMNLSLRRANAVARIAKASGARINGIRGYGERQPKASNASAAGMAQNRRVEIMCIR